MYLLKWFTPLAILVLLLARPLPVRTTSAETSSGTHTVCSAGPPACDFTTIQAAVDISSSGDLIKVAGGTYTDLHARSAPSGYIGPAVITQVVYITQAVTIRGGYTTTNGFADPPNPATNRTTLNAHGQGRVLLVAGDITPTIDGLHITEGSAAGLEGVRWYDAGGAIFCLTATATISGNQIFSNTAEWGGGIFLYRSSATLTGNSIISNTTSAASGGGVYIYESIATLRDNSISGNAARGYGGGLSMAYSTARIISNTFSANSANWYNGGGINSYRSDATLVGNTLYANRANDGGGLCLSESTAVLDGNTFFGNWARACCGGGLLLLQSAVTLSRNTVSSNLAMYAGGGLYLYQSKATVNGDTISGNGAGHYGGGLHLYSDSALTLTNSVIADNGASHCAGAGLCIWGSSARLLHSTIARNRGGEGGSGVCVGDDPWGAHSIMTLTSTILVSHTVGITVSAGSTATLEATLWGSGDWANGTDCGGTGTIITGTINVWGEPAFVDPEAGDYHISPGSAALDRGIEVWVRTDIDHQPRPYQLPDLGADEYWPPGTLREIHLPLILHTGATR